MGDVKTSVLCYLASEKVDSKKVADADVVLVIAAPTRGAVNFRVMKDRYGRPREIKGAEAQQLLARAVQG